MKTLVSAALAGAFALASSIASAQQPGPQMPATPSLNQKGSEDMSKPAGAGKAAAPATRSRAMKPPAAKLSAHKSPAKTGRTKSAASKRKAIAHSKTTKHNKTMKRPKRAMIKRHATGHHR